MENKNIKHFKNDIRKTFIIYAFIPLIIVMVFSYIITFFILYTTVVNRNKNINTEVSKRIESVISSYMNEAEKISIHADVINCLDYQRISCDIYEELYNFLNNMEIKGAFFVFDKNMKPVIASTTILPEYAQDGNAFTGGITRRMLDMPNQVVLAREAWVNSEKQTLSIGKSIARNGEIIGFVTFDLDEKELLKIISQEFSIDIVVTDKYGNVISSTNTLLINQFNKIDINFRDKLGFVKSTNDNHYVSITKILDQNMCIYAITTMGYFAPILVFSGIMLILLLGISALITYFVAEKVANSKTKVIDDIIEAIENVQNGNLDVLLNIDTEDEFQVIATSYNQMLIDIKNLIEVNKEQARQSVLSEIKQLESQFNPHFLFNTLEIIKYMVK
ncbi:MAG: HAMP domain-containing protein, partial [Clostridiaceae bacterium]|nr:HAMP domain-containing protein [Clostridiaceae bacterium]